MNNQSNSALVFSAFLALQALVGFHVYFCLSILARVVDSYQLPVVPPISAFLYQHGWIHPPLLCFAAGILIINLSTKRGLLTATLLTLDIIYQISILWAGFYPLLSITFYIK